MGGKGKGKRDGVRKSWDRDDRDKGRGRGGSFSTSDAGKRTVYIGNLAWSVSSATYLFSI